MKKFLKEIARDARVSDVSDESANGDGYWVYLRDRFADLSHDPLEACHVIHEWTAQDVRRRMKDIRPCSCVQCGNAAERRSEIRPFGAML